MEERSRQSDGLMKIFEVNSQCFEIVFQLHERTDETGIFDLASPWVIVECIAKPGRIGSAFCRSHVFSGFNRCQYLFKRCSDLVIQ